MKYVATLLVSLLLVGATSVPSAAPDTDWPASAARADAEARAAFYHLRQAAAAETRTAFIQHFQRAIAEAEKQPQSKALTRALSSTKQQDVAKAIDGLVESGDLSKRTAQSLKQSIEAGTSPSATRALIYAQKDETKYTMMLAKMTLVEAELLETMAWLASDAYKGDDMSPTAYGTSMRDVVGGAFGGALTGGGVGAGVGGSIGAVGGGIIGGGVGGPPGSGGGAAIGGGSGAIVGGAWGAIIGAIVGIFWEITEPDEGKGEGSSETQEAASEGESEFKADPNPNNPCNNPMSDVLC